MISLHILDFEVNAGAVPSFGLLRGIFVDRTSVSRGAVISETLAVEASDLL